VEILSRTYKARNIYLFLVPIFALYIAFSILPILRTLQLSFFDAKILKEGSYVGLSNFKDLLSDRYYLQALTNTLIFTFAQIPLVLGTALMLAVLVSAESTRGKTFFKVVYFLPTVTSPVAVAYAWSWIYSPTHGMLNVLLGYVGIDGPAWLSDPRTALAAIIVANAWRHIGFYMIIYIANLQAIDPALHEAAAIDGAGAWQEFRMITWPLVTPATKTGLVLCVTSFLASFALVQVMTRGGPAGATESIVTYVWKQAFATGFFKFGYAAAASAILFLILLFFFYIINRIPEVDR
jgi:ABC-type sugar transport system permease subunit